MLTEEKEPIVFIHIPKTGGMSCLKALEQLASSQVTIRLQEFSWLYRSGTWSNNILTQSEMISGHIPCFHIRNDSEARQNKNNLCLNNFAISRCDERCRASNCSVK